MPKRRIHIAYVCGDRGVPVGGGKGASLHVAELTRALASLDVDVSIVCARSETTGHSDVSSAEVIDVGAGRWSRRMRKRVALDGRGPEAKAAAAETRSMLLNDAFAHELSRLHRRRPIDAVYERYSLWTWAGVAFAERNALPHLMEVNAPLVEEQERYRDLVAKRAAIAIRRYLFETTDRILVPSAALVDHVVKQGGHPGAVRVVPNAADPQRFAPRRGVRDKGKDTFVIAFLGSIKPWHGLDGLVRSFVRLHRRDPSYRLRIIGDGPIRADVEAQLAKAGVSDAAEITGAVPYDEVPVRLADADVAVAPYERMKGFYFSPIKIFEYMAAGLPIVGARLGQIEELLHHGENALLVTPGSVMETCRAIERVRRSPALAEKLGGNARRRLVARHTWRHNGRRVLDYIASLERAAGRDS